MSRPIVVIKVGGSLLDWPGLPGRLAAYLRVRSADRCVLVVGGGKFADAFRDHDRRHALGEARAHALALRVLDLTAHILADLVPNLTVIESIDELSNVWARAAVPVLAPRTFLDRDDDSPDRLPHTWATTTDAIAARLALRLGAGELVLLKSVDMPAGIGFAEAARLGLVDPEFGRASEEIPTKTFVKLRDFEPERRTVQSSSGSAFSSG